MDETTYEKVIAFIYKLQAYHSYEVVGIENIPQEGAALIVCTHSLATYDIALLAGKIFDVYGRNCRSLTDRLFFKIPILAEFVKASGGVEGNQKNAIELLDGGNLVTVAPGGMNESLRPSEQRYQIRWDHRKGFAKLSIESGAPIVLAACPKADDLYAIYDSFISKWIYKKFRVPFTIARGWGFTPLPRPVVLTHYLSEPIHPPKLASTEAAKKKQLNDYHAKLKKRMESLIGEAIAHRPEKS